MPRPTHAYRGISQPSRLIITEILMRRPGLGLGELADLTSLHENTLRDHLRVLSDESLVRSETERRAGRGRPRLVYFAIEASTDNEPAQRRIDNAMRQGDLLRRVMPTDPVDLDEGSLHQLDVLYDHLDSVGLNPEMEEAELLVHMTPCPFHQLIAAHPETVCSVHEGLVRNVLTRAGGPLEVDRLLPFVTPHRCELRLRLVSEE